MHAECTIANAGYEGIIADALLREKEASAPIAMRERKRARKCFEEALALRVAPVQESSEPSHVNGSSAIKLYESECARSNKTTPTNWAVGDEIDGLIQALQSF